MQHAAILYDIDPSPRTAAMLRARSAEGYRFICLDTSAFRACKLLGLPTVDVGDILTAGEIAEVYARAIAAIHPLAQRESAAPLLAKAGTPRQDFKLLQFFFHEVFFEQLLVEGLRRIGVSKLLLPEAGPVNLSLSDPGGAFGRQLASAPWLEVERTGALSRRSAPPPVRRARRALKSLLKHFPPVLFRLPRRSRRHRDLAVATYLFLTPGEISRHLPLVETLARRPYVDLTVIVGHWNPAYARPLFRHPGCSVVMFNMESAAIPVDSGEVLTLVAQQVREQFAIDLRSLYPEVFAAPNAGPVGTTGLPHVFPRTSAPRSVFLSSTVETQESRFLAALARHLGMTTICFPHGSLDQPNSGLRLFDHYLAANQHQREAFEKAYGQDAAVSVTAEPLFARDEYPPASDEYHVVDAATVIVLGNPITWGPPGRILNDWKIGMESQFALIAELVAAAARRNLRVVYRPHPGYPDREFTALLADALPNLAVDTSNAPLAALAERCYGVVCVNYFGSALQVLVDQHAHKTVMLNTSEPLKRSLDGDPHLRALEGRISTADTAEGALSALERRQGEDGGGGIALPSPAAVESTTVIDDLLGSGGRPHTCERR